MLLCQQVEIKCIMRGELLCLPFVRRLKAVEASCVCSASENFSHWTATCRIGRTGFEYHNPRLQM